MKSLMNLLPFKREEKDIPVKRTSPAGGDHPMYQMRRELDHLFDRFLGDSFSLGPWSGGGLGQWYGDFSPPSFAPSIDIADEKNCIRVTAELPGMEDKDVEVALSGDRLVIRGEKSLEETSKDDAYYRTERSYGAFERAIPLPVEVDQNHVEATFRKGVLTVRLPKVSAAPAAKKIPVRAS